MGDVAWLTGSLTLAAGLIGWLVRWIVRWQEKLREGLRDEVERERRISGDWRVVAETEQANSARTNEILTDVLETQRRILAILERPPWVDTAPSAGWRGSAEYDGNRTPRHASLRPP